MIGVLAALKREVSHYLEMGGFSARDESFGVRCYRSKERDIVVALSGVGRVRAEEASRALLQRFDLDALISVGFAGGAKPGQSTGDVYVCDRIWCAEGPPNEWSVESAHSLALDTPPVEGAGRGFATGQCLTAPALVRSSAAKRRLGELFPVAVLDMEGYWVCNTASQYGVPAMVVKSVLDPVEQSLPAFTESALAADGSESLWRSVSAIMARPLEVPDALRLAAQTRAAGAALAVALDAFGAVAAKKSATM